MNFRHARLLSVCIGSPGGPGLVGAGWSPTKGLGLRAALWLKWRHPHSPASVSLSQRLYAWTQAGTRTRTSQAAGAASAADTLPGSTDSGLSCGSASEPGSSLSEPLTPDAGSHSFSVGPELEHEEGLGSLAIPESPPQLGPPCEAIEEHGQWLALCIQALEREVTEEELAQVDGAVDALAGWGMFTGQLPAPRPGLPCSRDGPGLRRVLGGTLSSLRRKLSTRRLARAGSSPCRWRAEEN